MVFSKWTTYTITSPNYSSRNGREITGWIIHHNATTNGEYVLALMHTGDKQVSANYQIMDNGDTVGVVDEDLRSWSASNADWDGHSITFETENESGAPNWGISSAAQQAIARVIADSSERYGIPINSTTVRGHNQGSGQGDGGSYATACPGPSMNVAYIIELANSIKTAGGGTTPIDNTPVDNYVPQEDFMLIHFTTNDKKDGPVGEWAVIGSGFAHKISAGSWPTANQVAANYTRGGSSIWLTKDSYDKWVNDSLAATK